jgi:hypothetical protein
MCNIMRDLIVGALWPPSSVSDVRLILHLEVSGILRVWYFEKEQISRVVVSC